MWVFGVEFFVFLLVNVFDKLMNAVLEAKWESARPLHIRKDGEHSDASDLEYYPDEDCETGTVMAYQGEPWFALVNLWSWGLQSGAVGVAFLTFLLRGDEILGLASEWINVHPFWSGAIGLTCLPVAFALGALRQVFIKLMSLAVALPIVGEDGRPSLAYIGDVPPFIWQHSPWLRAGSWLAVTATSLICAYIGAELLSQALDGGYVLLFVLLLMIRWAVSSIPSHIWVG